MMTTQAEQRNAPQTTTEPGLPQDFDRLSTDQKVDALKTASEIQYNQTAVLEALPMSLEEVRNLPYNEMKDTFFTAFRNHSGLDADLQAHLKGHKIGRLDNEPPPVHNCLEFERLLTENVTDPAEREAIRDAFYPKSRECIAGLLKSLGEDPDQPSEYGELLQLRQQIVQMVSAAGYQQPEDRAQADQLVEGLLQSQNLPENLHFLLRHSAYTQAGIVDEDEFESPVAMGPGKAKKGNDADQAGSFDASFRDTELRARSRERINENLES